MHPPAAAPPVPQIRPQAAAIGRRIGQTIDMVDPNAIDQPLLVQAEQRRVRRLEYGFILDAQSHQTVDVEERRQLVASPALRHQASR